MTKLIKFIKAVFCNMNPYYYFRHFVFGVAMSAFMLAVAGESRSQIIVTTIICTLLYPYSRFVYETVIDFIMGDNVIISNVFLMLGWKFITIGICYGASPFIAPIGLVLLYFLKRKNIETEIE